MNSTAPAHDFKNTAQAALNAADAVLSHWLPDGKYQDHEYQALNPTRADSKPGSFKINTTSGQWADFATDDKGGDFVSLIAFLDGCKPGEAETRLAEFLGLHSKNVVTPVTPVTRNNNVRKNSGLSDIESVTSKANALVTVVTPIPDEAPPTYTHPKYGKPAHVWAYRTADGRPHFYICRYDTPEGKEIRPRTWNGKAWQWKSVPAPRPLYNLHDLADRPDAPVLVAEGEKAADAAAGLLPDCVATTTPNGAKAPDRADFSPLEGRRVLIWPDNDDQGTKYADKVAALAHEAGAASVSILNLDKLPGELPPKGDAADVTGWIHDTGAALLANSEAWQVVPKPTESPAMPDRFSLEAEGVYYRGIDKEGNDLTPEWICSPLEVTAMTRDADGNAWGRLLEFHDQDNHPHRWAMPLELLAGDGSEYRRALLSMGLQIAPSTRARQKLTEYLQTAPVKARARCVTKTGWHNGVFVLPDDTIGENGERVLLQSLHEPANMRTAGTLDEWRDSVGRYCKGNSRLTLAVSAAFAAPLLDITGDESGGINFQGASSTGKTTALNAAVSVWGGPDYLQRWRATTNGLEAAATAHNDAPLCLDELAQVEAREAGAVAYMLANGTGKQRAKRDGLAKPKATWRLLFLSAGEIGIAQHMLEAGRKARAGQEVRLADIPADAGAGYGLFENLHTYPTGAELSDAINAAARTYYGTPARKYLAALVTMNGDKLRERLRTLRADFTREALPDSADGQARRVCDRFALIAGGGELATGMHLTGWQPGEATQAARTCFKAWIDHRGGAGAQEEKTALAQVRQFFELHGESRFSHLDSTDTREPRTINRAGFKRHSGGMAEYFVLPEAWKSEVCNGLDSRYVARLCVERGLIKPSGDGRPTCTHRLSDMGPTRCYHFIKTGPNT